METKRFFHIFCITQVSKGRMLIHRLSFTANCVVGILIYCILSEVVKVFFICQQWEPTTGLPSLLGFKTAWGRLTIYRMTHFFPLPEASGSLTSFSFSRFRFPGADPEEPGTDPWPTSFPSSSTSPSSSSKHHSGSAGGAGASSTSP